MDEYNLIKEAEREDGSLLGKRQRERTQVLVPNIIEYLKGQFQGQQTRGERGECCLARSLPSPPLAPAPFKICAHFWEGCRR